MSNSSSQVQMKRYELSTSVVTVFGVVAMLAQADGSWGEERK